MTHRPVRMATALSAVPVAIETAPATSAVDTAQNSRAKDVSPPEAAKNRLLYRGYTLTGSAYACTRGAVTDTALARLTTAMAEHHATHRAGSPFLHGLTPGGPVGRCTHNGGSAIEHHAQGRSLMTDLRALGKALRRSTDPDSVARTGQTSACCDGPKKPRPKKQTTAGSPLPVRQHYADSTDFPINCGQRFATLHALEERTTEGRRSGCNPCRVHRTAGRYRPSVRRPPRLRVLRTFLAPLLPGPPGRRLAGVTAPLSLAFVSPAVLLPG